MLPGGPAHRDLAARASAAKRQTWPCHRLSPCHSFPAPQADGAAQSGLSRPALSPSRLRPCIRRLARWNRRETSVPHHGRSLAGIGERPACRTMVGLLALAHERACEAELGAVLQATLDDGILPDLKALIERFRPKGMALPVVIVTLPSLAIYDQIAAAVGEAA